LKVESSPHRLPRTAWLAAALFVLLLLPKIGAGTFWHHDELLTANRSRELLVRGDPFAVTLNFAPSVKKPPLQFWLCALLLRALPAHPELAIRLPTLLAGAGCLLAAAWLAQVCFPASDPSLATWAALMLAGCGYLIHTSRIALLDPGAALLLTLALAGCRLAWRAPRWWWFVALLCVLGAWQKAPYGLAAWALLLFARRVFRAPPPDAAEGPPQNAVARWTGPLPAAFIVATFGALGWWAIEWMRAGHMVLARAGYEQTQMFLRAHDPGDPGLRPWLYWGWLARDWAVPGLCAPVAVLAGLFAWRRERGMAEVALVCVVFGGVMAGLVYRSERYLVLITPALAVVIVHGLQRLSLRLPPGWRRWLLPAALASTLPVAAFHYFEPSPGQPDLWAIARNLAHTLRPDERILVSTDARSGFDTPEFVLFYANLRRPLEEVSLQTSEHLDARSGPCRGICGLAQWPELSHWQPAAHRVATRGDWVLWAR
jgi:4-amino-4-deoxy-L-arabinose transferase-like glycosyltransferase